MLISVIIPVFNEEVVLPVTYRRLATVLPNGERHTYEFIFVDDGSRDRTSAILGELASADSRVCLVRFSRNFGHQPAVSAGLRHCRGDIAAVIDADLQDPPELIPQMVEELLRTGSNVVYGVRTQRKGESFFKRACASLFYLVLNKLCDVSLPMDAGDFRIMDRKVVDQFNQLQENNKYVRGLISWLGFKQTPFYYVREPRFAGAPKYTFRKSLRLASTGIFYFSKKPLKLATAFGFASVAVGLVLSLWILFNKIVNPQFLITGWASIILMVIYFGGVQLLTIGILGQYIGSLFDEVKRRPEYIVHELRGFPARAEEDEHPPKASRPSRDGAARPEHPSWDADRALVP
jgi:dolichol-phosphate mannosyltransferase